MRRVLKYIAIGLGGLLLLVGSAVTVLSVKGPASRPPSPEKVEATPERVERGHYLAHSVMTCFFCHGERKNVMVQPVVEGTEGVGKCFEDGFPGKLCFSNITPHPTAGLGAWTDGEVLRAIREGIGRDGRALVPVMPYKAYRYLSDEDARALVAYLRTLAPRDTVVPPSETKFPVSLIFQGQPQPLEGAIPPPPAEGVAYGRYLTGIAGCKDCHGEDLSGGAMEIPTPLGRVVGANITPDKETGIGQWSRGVFISRFKSYLSMDPTHPATPKTTTEMPWLQYAGMTEKDLGAIYDYLMSVPAVSKQVVVRPDANAARAANTGG